MASVAVLAVLQVMPNSDDSTEVGMVVSSKASQQLG